MATASTETPARTAYRIRADQIEACNCSVGCGCQFEGFPDYGPCEFIIAYKIDEGRFGDVDLEGVRAVVVGKYPKAIHEGNGHVAVFIDESARPEQVEALATVFSGQVGGMPWEALAGTISKLEGPILKPIEMTLEGRRSRLRVPGALEMNLTPLINPVTGEEKEVHIVYPQGGFFWDDGDVATTETMRVDFGDIQFDHQNHYASKAVANWTNQA